MAKCQKRLQGDGRLYLFIAAGTFLIGLLLSSFLFPPAHAEDLLIDLKASMPLPLPPEPARMPEPQAVSVPLPSSEQELISLLSSEYAPAEPQEEKWQTIRMKVTGYCACSRCCGHFADGITACNHRIQKGDAFVAADKSYNFGTQMIIPGYYADRPVRVMDRGGAIQGNHLDLFFHTHQEALEWGVQYLDVQIKTN